MNNHRTTASAAVPAAIEILWAENIELESAAGSAAIVAKADNRVGAPCFRSVLERQPNRAS